MRTATLETLLFNFPATYQYLKEIKLDGAVYKASESGLIVNSGVLIENGSWTEEDVGKRELNAGETRTLEIRFTKKQDKNLYNDDIPMFFSGSVTFAEGCADNL